MLYRTLSLFYLILTSLYIPAKPYDTLSYLILVLPHSHYTISLPYLIYTILHPCLILSLPYSILLYSFYCILALSYTYHTLPYLIFGLPYSYYTPSYLIFTILSYLISGLTHPYHYILALPYD